MERKEGNVRQRGAAQSHRILVFETLYTSASAKTDNLTLSQTTLGTEARVRNMLRLILGIDSA